MGPRSAPALAIFSCVQAGLLEVVRLPSEIEPSVVFDTVAWLEPLADMVSFGNRGVAVLSGGTARLFRGGASALTEFAFLDLAPGHERAQLGFQGPCDRNEQDGFAAHVGRVADQLLRAHRRRSFEHLVIVACDQPRRVIDASIDQQLRDMLRGIIDADLGRASSAEIMHVVTPMIEGAERAQERAALTMLEDSIGAERTVASGLERALAMLQQRHVELLLIAEGARSTAGLCPLCGWVSTNRRSCKLDGTDLASVNGYAEAVVLAEEQAARVMVVSHELDAMIEHGSIATLPRADARRPRTFGRRLARQSTRGQMRARASGAAATAQERRLAAADMTEHEQANHSAGL